MKTHENTSISHIDVISFESLAKIAKESLAPLVEWHDERAVINFSIILDIMSSVFEDRGELSFNKSDVFEELHEGDTSTLDSLFAEIEENYNPYLIGSWYIESYLEEAAEQSGVELSKLGFPFNFLSWDHRAIENCYQFIDVNGEEYFFEKRVK